MILLICLLSITIGILLYIRFRSGMMPSAHLHRINRESDHHDGRQFNPPEPVVTANMGPGFFLDFLLSRHRPPHALPSVTPLFSASPAPLQVVWMGHSFLIVDIDGVRLMLDPVFGAASPLPFSVRRFQPPPLTREELPAVDAVIVSHNHYDHLEQSTARFLAKRGDAFLTPLGVRARLREWGGQTITELNWHESARVTSRTAPDQSITVTATPARHFSGRSLGDRNLTLWASWVIKGPRHAVFFSADGGYGRHFAAIGEQYGPFDISLMETGAWDRRWPFSHQVPEQSVQAHLDVQGAVMMPIHWAAYDLAFHEWDEPIRRTAEAAQKKGVLLATPRMGELWTPGTPTTEWWKSIPNPSYQMPA